MKAALSLCGPDALENQPAASPHVEIDSYALVEGLSICEKRTLPHHQRGCKKNLPFPLRRLQKTPGQGRLADHIFKKPVERHAPCFESFLIMPRNYQYCSISRSSSIILNKFGKFTAGGALLNDNVPFLEIHIRQSLLQEKPSWRWVNGKVHHRSLEQNAW